MGEEAELLALFTEEPFSADTLYELSRNAQELQGSDNPGALFVFERAASAIASRWDRGSVTASEAREIQVTFEQPLRDLLEALEKGTPAACYSAADRVASLVREWRQG